MSESDTSLNFRLPENGNGNEPKQERLLRMVPIDLDGQGNPKDARLGTAVQEYAKKEFGTPLAFNFYMRCWCLLALKEDDPDYFEVIGVTGVRQTLDCPLFHLTPLTEDKEGLRLAEQARDLAFYRMSSYLQDWGMSGATVLVYVSERAQRYWRRFLGKIKAMPANRFEVRI
jgi:hypothetical protein